MRVSLINLFNYSNRRTLLWFLLCLFKSVEQFSSLFVNIELRRELLLFNHEVSALSSFEYKSFLLKLLGWKLSTCTTLASSKLFHRNDERRRRRSVKEMLILSCTRWGFLFWQPNNNRRWMKVLRMKIFCEQKENVFHRWEELKNVDCL